MDLVKIRKKAKTARKKPAEKQVKQEDTVLSSCCAANAWCSQPG